MPQSMTERELTKRLGWRPSLPDHRDLKFHMRHVGPLPRQVDLRPEMPVIWEQGSVGSCTANAAGAIWQHVRRKTLPDLMPSRLFVYYNTRILENSTGFDSGASLRNTLKAMARWGVADEDKWPYQVQ